MIRQRTTLVVTPSVPLHEIVVINTNGTLTVVPQAQPIRVCTTHTVVQLPHITEITFDQEGRRTVLYADRYCTTNGTPLK